jgi:hypothetical protein
MAPARVAGEASSSAMEAELTKTIIPSLVAVLAALAAAAPAAAGSANRAWVSGHGVDQAGCGTPTSPCRSLQYAHDNVVAAGGEIDVLDTAGYGAITITKAISIVNDGVGTAGVQATSGAAITVNAGANDSIYLKGLNIDGVQFAGANGVAFNGGGSLSMVNCVVRHFSSAGVVLAVRFANAAISDTLIANNDGDGLQIAPSGDGQAGFFAVIDGDRIYDNAAGVTVNGGVAFAGQVQVSISNTIADSNSGDGVSATGAPSAAAVLVNVDQSEMSGDNDGLAASAAAVVHLSRSELSQNVAFGIVNSTTTGHMFSTGDNRVLANGTMPVSGTTPSPDPLL